MTGTERRTHAPARAMLPPAKFFFVFRASERRSNRKFILVKTLDVFGL
jgi:hypothetical protein